MPPRKPMKPLYRALDIHRRKLAQLVEDRGTSRIKKLYDRAQADLAAKLRRTAPDRRGAFTAHQHRIVLAQVQQGQALIAARMAGEAGDLSREAQVESLRGLGNTITALEKEYTGAELVLPIDEASRFWGVVDKQRSKLRAAHERSMSAYSGRVIGKIEEQLALALTTGETTHEAIDRVQEVADNEFYQAERIVRTECAFAFNQTSIDGITALSEEIPDILMQWVEHVDENGEPLDDRVGADSIAMAWQLARPGGGWTMPDDADGVSESLLGETFYSAPCRPNGREVIQAWRKHWGLPGWIWEGGAKVWLSR